MRTDALRVGSGTLFFEPREVPVASIPRPDWQTHPMMPAKQPAAVAGRLTSIGRVDLAGQAVEQAAVASDVVEPAARDLLVAPKKAIGDWLA